MAIISSSAIGTIYSSSSILAGPMSVGDLAPLAFHTVYDVAGLGCRRVDKGNGFLDTGSRLQD